MLRKAAGNASAARHSRRAERRGGEKVAVRRAAHVPLGRPFVYEPHRTGHEPIALCELEALFELETESTPSVGSDNEGHGWKALFESDGAICEQWIPEPEDPNEAQLCIFRTSLNLPGIPPSVAFEQLYEVSKRRSWDTRLARLKQVKSAPRREGEGGIQSDLLHLRVDPLLSFLPACEFVLWRGCLPPPVDANACTDPTAFILRNADVEVSEDINGDTSGDWVGPIRVRKLVHGCIVRSLDPNNDQAGSKIFGYVQMKVNSTLQYLVPSLAGELALGSRDSFRAACLAAVAAQRPVARSLSMGVLPRRSLSAYESDSDASVCTSMCEFLGGAPTNALASRKERRRATRQSLAQRRSSGISERPVLRAVQLHRSSSFSVLDPGPLLSPFSDTASEPDSATGERRAARRARSRASQRESMAVFADRLTEVMSVRGSALETLAEDPEVDACQDIESVPLVETVQQPEMHNILLPEKEVPLVQTSVDTTMCAPEAASSTTSAPESPTRKRFAFPLPSRRNREANRCSEQQPPDQTFEWLASPESHLEMQPTRSNVERKSLASSTPSTPRSEWFDGSAPEKATDASLKSAVSKIMLLGKVATSIAPQSPSPSHVEVPRQSIHSAKLDAVYGSTGPLKQVAETSKKSADDIQDEFPTERSQDRRKNEPEPGPEPGPDTISCPGSPSRRSREEDVSKINLGVALDDLESVYSSRTSESQSKALSAAESILFCSTKELVTVSRIRQKESKKKHSGEGRIKIGEEKRRHRHSEDGKQRKSKHKEESQEEVWV